MHYRVDALFRNSGMKELRRRTPIWTGEANDSKSAVVQAHEAITAECKANAQIDSISITVTGQDGSVVHTTEYAEDFTIGYGASALGNSSLGREGIETGLTDEQREQAMEHMKTRAVQALPGSIQEQLRQRAVEEADPLREFFGGELPSERKAREGQGGEEVTLPVGGPFRDGGSGGESSDPGRDATQQGRHTVSAGPGCDKTYNDCKNKFNNVERFTGLIDPITGKQQPCPWRFGSKQCGVKPSQHYQRGSAGNHGGSPDGRSNPVPAGHVDPASASGGDKERGRKLLEGIRESAARMNDTTGRTPIGIVLNPSDARDIARALGVPPGGTLNGGIYNGMTISVDPQMGSIGPKLVLGDSTGIYKAAGGRIDSRSYGHPQYFNGLDADSVKQVWVDGYPLLRKKVAETEAKLKSFESIVNEAQGLSSKGIMDRIRDHMIEDLKSPNPHSYIFPRK